MQRLTDSIHTEPFLISQLVRHHQSANWPCSRLGRPGGTSVVGGTTCRMDVDLVKLDFLRITGLSMRGEFTHHDATIEYYHQHPEQLFDSTGDDDNSRVMPFPVRIAWRLRLIPTGWFYQNRLVALAWW